MTALLLAVLLQSPVRPETAVLTAYIEAVGGEPARRAVRTRITEGQFDNGRGMRAPYRVYEQSPDKRATVLLSAPIESEHGSGRGFDGVAGWDKNFVGTGLRVLEGQELIDLKRDADMLRPLHLFDACTSTSVESNANGDVVTCERAGGAHTRFHFDRGTHLLTQEESPLANNRGTITVAFEDYRPIDGIRLPFRTRVQLPGATIVYTVASIRHNEPIADRVFAKPAR